RVLSAIGRTTVRLLLILFFVPARDPCSPLFPYTTLFRSLETINKALGLSDLRAKVRKCEDELRQLNTDLGYAVPGAHGTMCGGRSEEHTSELQSRFEIVCRPLLEKKSSTTTTPTTPRFSP